MNGERCRIPAGVFKASQSFDSQSPPKECHIAKTLARFATDSTITGKYHIDRGGDLLRRSQLTEHIGWTSKTDMLGTFDSSSSRLWSSSLQWSSCCSYASSGNSATKSVLRLFMGNWKRIGHLEWQGALSADWPYRQAICFEKKSCQKSFHQHCRIPVRSRSQTSFWRMSTFSKSCVHSSRSRTLDSALLPNRDERIVIQKWTRRDQDVEEVWTETIHQRYSLTLTTRGSALSFVVPTHAGKRQRPTAFTKYTTIDKRWVDQHPQSEWTPIWKMRVVPWPPRPPPQASLPGRGEPRTRIWSACALPQGGRAREDQNRTS